MLVRLDEDGMESGVEIVARGEPRHRDGVERIEDGTRPHRQAGAAQHPCEDDEGVGELAGGSFFRLPRA